jgi:L-threonylcarbamoyladenylate synthase
LRSFATEEGSLSEEALDHICAALLADELLIYPTDTLYAVGGLAHSSGAALRVRDAKAREPGKPLPLVAADLAQVHTVCAAVPEDAARLGAAFWPGPLTLVLTAAAGLPQEVTAGTGTVAVRVPSLELTRRLCTLAGALVSTSANRAGEPAGLTFAEAVEAVGRHVACGIDGGPGGRGIPSTIVDLTGEEPQLLREGAVVWEAVRRVLRLR